METLKTIALTLGYVASIAAFLGSSLKFLEGYKKMIAGQKCQLRAAMLHTYYRNLEHKQIRQYEMENFLQMFYLQQDFCMYHNQKNSDSKHLQFSFYSL